MTNSNVTKLGNAAKTLRCSREEFICAKAVWMAAQTPMPYDFWYKTILELAADLDMLKEEGLT